MKKNKGTLYYEVCDNCGKIITRNREVIRSLSSGNVYCNYDCQTNFLNKKVI